MKKNSKKSSKKYLKNIEYFENYEDFVLEICDKYDIDFEDFSELMKYGMDNFWLANVIEIMKKKTRVKRKEYNDIEEKASDITTEYFDEHFNEFEEEEIVPLFDNIPPLNGREGEF